MMGQRRWLRRHFRIMRHWGKWLIGKNTRKGKRQYNRASPQDRSAQLRKGGGDDRD